MTDPGCLLCDPEHAAEALNRETVWEDRLWRLSMPRRGYTTGFGYLEPRRHVPHITDLEGDEAATSPTSRSPAAPSASSAVTSRSCRPRRSAR